MNDLHIPNNDWYTISSHPASGTGYQEAEMTGADTWARVVVNGREIVSPSINTEQVYREYNGRVQRAIEDLEENDS